MTSITTNLPLIVTVAAGVFGVVLGALLRPVAEEWFARRRKTLHIVVDFVNVVKTPHESVKLEWRDHRIDQLVVFGFRLKNKTGRTLRNFTLELFLQKKPSDSDFSYIALQPTDGVKFDQVRNEEDSVEFKFQYVGPKAVVPGNVIASYASALNALTMDDYEVRVTKSSDAQSGRLLREIGASFTFAAAAAAFAAVLSAGLG